MKVSVCIATYNGEKFIKEQLDSILLQLGELDEVIISDDYSEDKTLEIISEIQDKRINIHFNTLGKGVVKNFENAIRHSTGDIILFCDQDDIWRSDKVEKINKIFRDRENITCVFSNARLIDGNGDDLGRDFFMKPPKLSVISVLVKNKFLGCTMAIRKNTKFNILPFSSDLPMHDWYVGLKNLLKGRVFFIDECLINYRRHGNNVTTGKRSPFFMLVKWRFKLIVEILKKK